MFEIYAHHFCDPLIVCLIGRMGFVGEFFQRYIIENPASYFEVTA